MTHVEPSIDPWSQKAGDTDLIHLVTFRIDDDEFGVDILNVREIIHMMGITRVPKSPGYVEGIINLRGRVIPVVNLRLLFDMEQVEATKETRIVVLEIQDKTLGFIVDSVSEVLRLSHDRVNPPPDCAGDGSAKYISGVGKLDDRLLILLDMGKLFGMDISLDHS